MAERCSCPFTRLFVMCDLLLPHCCFMCDLVFPDQMAISCLTCPLYSCRTVCGKKSDTEEDKATIRTLHNIITISCVLNCDLSSPSLTVTWYSHPAFKNLYLIESIKRLLSQCCSAEKWLLRPTCLSSF